MSSEIKERLKISSENCLKCYEAWSGNEKDVKARESLQEAIHELRKVASRLEIDLAISERDQMAQRPIPIPPHRDAKKPRSPGGGSRKPEGESAGNAPSSAPDNNNGPKVEVQKRRRPSKPAASEG